MTAAGLRPGVAAVAPRAVGARTFTREQRAAIDARPGSWLLSANAGSGKTAVMVERFAEAVICDGVGVGEILALTFTEKAAGELRERLRRRFAELGETELVREADSAWVGTIHGFCARLLRSEPLAAGLDPRFGVLDAPAAVRVAERAYEAAFEQWADAVGEPALALAAAYGAGLQQVVVDAHAALRSGGETHPRLPLPPAGPRPDAARLRAARAAAAAALAAARDGKQVDAARELLAAGGQVLAAFGESGPVPAPSALAPLKLRGGRALSAPECDDYRRALEDYSQACADHHARAALVLLDDLLVRFGELYAAEKAARGAVDFADLELGARDLLARAHAVRARWRERFALVMIDEFQDTNRVQLDVLEALERDNLFAVGDELQSIYGFRHADVAIFRERRARLGEERTRRLTANFRSRPELIDILNVVFAPVFGSSFTPLRAGMNREQETSEPVELLLTDSPGWDGREDELGLAGLAAQPWRRAEARRLADRLAAELARGRSAGDIVVLVRSTGSLRLFEQALEERGIPTYVLGGRGYWSHEQVRDGLAYLSALANPLDEQSLLTAMASPFCGAGADALITIARAGREAGGGLWEGVLAVRAGPALHHLVPEEAGRVRAFAAFLCAERGRAERLSPEVLLERAVETTGYDLAILGRSGGDRRMANLRKLMRLARDYDRAEGRDLRGFLAFAAGQDLREAREGEAPLEAEDLDAIRLMTIHRAKGLEFPVVAVADLGRTGAVANPALLHSRDGRVGLRLATPGGSGRVDALSYSELATERAAAEDEEERRLMYVAMTRAQERLILSGGVDTGRLPAARPGAPPLSWILPALLGDPGAVLASAKALGPAGGSVALDGGQRRPQLRVVVTTPADAPALRPGGPPAVRVPSTADARGGAAPADSTGEPSIPTAPPPTRLSYTSLQAYARCPYRYYLQTRLRMPDVPPAGAHEHRQLAFAVDRPVLDPRTRGVVAHRLLEELDFGSPAEPAAARVAELLAEAGAPVAEPDDVAALRRLVAGFADSPLCARLTAAVVVRREVSFAYAPNPGSEPLITGVLDVHAVEKDGGVLVVDFKTDVLGDRSPPDVAAADYGLQRAVYGLAVLASGAARVEVAHCFLERPLDAATAVYEAGDARRLERQVLAAGTGILAERWPVAARPHRRLCGDCPGREALCSHEERLTLREL